MTTPSTKRKTKQAEPIDFAAEIAELQVLMRALGEEAIMMRNGGKLAEKENTYFGDIVTEADSLLEREIVKRIQTRYPEHCVRGEELGASRPLSAEDAICEYEWIVNPLDGTTNFSKGLKFFSIGVAFFDHGVPTMGVAYFPELFRFVNAVKGKGVHDNGKPLPVFARPKVEEMRRALIAGATTRRKAGRASMIGEIRMHSMNMVNTGSMMYNCLLLAEGKVDAVIHTDATIFNVAAVIPILEEAGCVVSGFEEKIPDLSRDFIPFIAASNPALLADIKKNILPYWEKVEH